MSGVVGTQELYPRIVAGLSGTSTVIWEDSRNGNVDIYAAHLSTDGFVTAAGVFPVVVAPETQDEIAAIHDAETREVIVTWQDGRSAGFNAEVYAQRFDITGKMKWEFGGIRCGDNGASQLDPTLALDSSGATVVSWDDHLPSGPDRVVAQRISAEGVRSAHRAHPRFLGPPGAGDHERLGRARRPGRVRRGQLDSQWL